jgi:hypothetical protein
MLTQRHISKQRKFVVLISDKLPFQNFGLWVVTSSILKVGVSEYFLPPSLGFKTEVFLRNVGVQSQNYKVSQHKAWRPAVKIKACILSSNFSFEIRFSRIRKGQASSHFLLVSMTMWIRFRTPLTVFVSDSEFRASIRVMTFWREEIWSDFNWSRGGVCVRSISRRLWRNFSLNPTCTEFQSRNTQTFADLPWSVLCVHSQRHWFSAF